MQIFDGSRVAFPARTSILDQLFEETEGPSAGPRLTLFLAPAGYGKHSTVASWLGDGSDDASVHWIDCSVSASEPLCQRISNLLTHFTGDPVPAPPRVHTHADSIHFAKALTQPLTLILNNYQAETSPETDLALARLAGASPVLSLVIIAQRVSLLAGPLIAAETRVRIVGTDDLAYTTEEQHALARNFGFPLTKRLKTTLASTEGWPLAIRAALNIGSDRHHLSGPDGTSPDTNLIAFAHHYLELAPPTARKVLLAATLLDAISTAQLTKILQIDEEALRPAINQVLELGVIREDTAPLSPNYYAHSAVCDALRPLAQETFTEAERHRLLVDRAQEIEETAPYKAFHFYCHAADYTEAERILAGNFTILTNETEHFANTLRTLPESVFLNHPTITAALLYLETPNPSVSRSTLDSLTRTWLTGLKRRLPNNQPSESDPIYLQLLSQVMVATRLTGQLATAQSLMQTLERRITPMHPAPGEQPFTGSLPTYYRELAATALSLGDFTHARRSLEQLRTHSIHLMRARWRGFGYAATRTVTDPQAGARWLLAAYSELSFIELIDGDINASAKYLDAMDSHAAASSEQAPGISWFGAEIVRANLAHEHNDPALLATAVNRLTPLKDRLEPWPILLIAETAMVRVTRGAEAALSHLRAALANDAQRPDRLPHEWGAALTAFQAMLSTTTGNLAQAHAFLEDTAASTAARIEQARLALYSGDDVTALLITESIGDPETSKRERIDQKLISATAAWSRGRHDDALAALTLAAEDIQKFGLTSKLLSVPYDLLAAVTQAARDAGVCDLTQQVDAVPQHARSKRYEALTEMELQSLAAIYTHRNARLAAESLHVTQATVKKHLVSVYKKLQVSDRDEAFLQACRMGLLQPTA